MIIATLSVVAVQWFLYRALRAGCALRLPVRADDWQRLPFDTVEPLREDSVWAAELAAIADVADERQRAVAGMAWLMNRVSTVDSPVAIDSPERMLAAIDAGQGALCGQMAYLYRHVLASLGLASRTVYLQRNPFDCYDDHTVVEARIDGRWILLDPTFNLVFRDRDGRTLDAFEIKRKVFRGDGADIVREFLGDVRYPVRTADYYVDMLALFTNVYVRDAGSSGWGRLPPLRLYFGPRLYYVLVDGESDASMTLWRRLYGLTALVLPITLLLFGAASLSLLVVG